MFPVRLLHFAFLVAIALIPAIAAAQTPTFSRLDLETTLPLHDRLIAGDFNSDGKPDLIVVSRSLVENYGIYLMIGRGDGTFEAPVQVLAPAFGTSLGAADVNGDGSFDLVFQTVENIWTLPGAGDGTFGPPILSPQALSGAPPLLVDLNHDGHIDRVVASQDDGVLVSLGLGDGRFDAPRLLPLGARIARVVAGEVDGDGNIDLLAANIGRPDAFDGAVVTVLFGAGDGTFGRRLDVPVGTTPGSIATLDGNGDGVLDIAASSYATAILSIAIGSGGAAFLPTTNYATAGLNTADTAPADVNGDGRQDIATCGAANMLSVFVNAGGTFAQRTDIPAASYCNSLAVADFNLDGRPDLAVNYFAASGTVSIFLNTTAAPIDSQPPAISAAANPSVLWPANGRTVSVTVSGTIVDDLSGVDTSTLAFTVIDEYGLVQPSGTLTIDSAGRYSLTVPLTASRRGDDKDGRTYRIVISAADLAGNEASEVIVVLVPHDRRPTM
jgi:hypothetical protein